MKATDTQYIKAVEIYNEHGQSAVIDFAYREGIDEWSYCPPCETDTPDCSDRACLVCGSVKPEPVSTPKTYRITETVTYEIHAPSEDKAARIFMESPNPSEFLVAVEDRSIEEVQP